MYTVYGRATSSNVQALLWGMEELGLTYSRLDYGEVFGGLDTPEFRAMNPHGRIPVLTDGDTALWETPAILRYLVTKHGDDSIWPKDLLARAVVDMWAEWSKHAIAEAFTGPVFWHAVRTKPENRQPDVIAQNLATFESNLAKLEPRLTAHDYICGSSLTLADIQCGHVLYRYYDIDIPRSDLPALRRYYDRLTKRAAYQRSVMVSYETLIGTF